MTLVLRPIRPEDNPKLAEIVVAVLLEFGLQGEGFACNDPELGRLSEVYQAEGSQYWVVENTETGEVLGGGGLTRLQGTTPDEGICELQKYYFLPAARGNGIGKALLEKTLEAAKALNYRYMYLETTPGMRQAIRLYERYGFDHLDAPMGSTGHGGCTVWMGKSMEPALQALS